MSNEQTIEKLCLNTAVRNAYVLRVKDALQKQYNTKSIPLEAVLIYMENFIKKLGGSGIAVNIIKNGIKDSFNADVTLKN